MAGGIMSADMQSHISASPAEGLLFGDFAREHYLPFAREHKKSWKTDERYLSLHVLPYLGAQPLADISSTILKDWLTTLEVSGLARTSCCRIFWLVKYMLNCACRWHLLPGDDAFRLAFCPRAAAVRQPVVLSREETLQLVRLLKEYHNRPGAQAIHLLLLTGAGKSEILNARWEDTDLKHGVLATSMTFTGHRRLIPLNSEAVRLIRGLRRRDDVPWLFFSSAGNRLSSLHYTWNLLRSRLGRPDLRLQDLRHTFAGFLVNMGIRQTELLSIMGHYMPQTLVLVQNQHNHTTVNNKETA